ncbi:MAG: winged helix-turn-helix domain-containing protein [Brevundimonas sp.]
MAPGCFRFDRFRLDPDERRLSRDDASVELNGRYFDALVLLVREQGRLVSKDRFLEEVWRGVPVTDEALTQCIRTLRRQLGDEAGRPRFIETVPKHGYRFIAPVVWSEAAAGPGAAVPAPTVPDLSPPAPWRRFAVLGGAGMAGGGAAGLVGGLLYGFAAAAEPVASGAGAASVVLVLALVTAGVGLMGGAGVGFGVAAAAGLAWGRAALWTPVGGAAGGMVVGAVVKLIGLDAFTLLLGQTPGAITGAGEGALLGGAVGFGAWLAGRAGVSLRRGVVFAGLAGAAAGVAIALLGGRLMGGSLALLARGFPDSRLRIDAIGGLFGEAGFGPISQTVTAGLEGALFAAAVVGALQLARRRPGDQAAGAAAADA